MTVHRILFSARKEAIGEFPADFPLDRVRLRRQVKAAVKDALMAEEFPPSEVSVTLVEDAFMRDLNRRWRGLGRTTDVLSFPQFESAEAARRAVSGEAFVVLGDVVVSPATVLRRAGPEWFWQDLRRVVVHGVLHLCGWDHATRAQRRRMRAREEVIGGMSPDGSRS